MHQVDKHFALKKEQASVIKSSQSIQKIAQSVYGISSVACIGLSYWLVRFQRQSYLDKEYSLTKYAPTPVEAAMTF